MLLFWLWCSQSWLALGLWGQDSQAQDLFDERKEKKCWLVWPKELFPPFVDQTQSIVALPDTSYWFARRVSAIRWPLSGSFWELHTGCHCLSSPGFKQLYQANKPYKKYNFLLCISQSFDMRGCKANRTKSLTGLGAVREASVSISFIKHVKPCIVFGCSKAVT